MEYIVNTRQGKLQGTKENNLHVFKGIPFALPPVGNLRWMPPQPVSSWKEVRPALEYGAKKYHDYFERLPC